MSEESRKHNSHAAESWRELAGDVRQWADGHRLAITATVALVVLNLVVWLVVAMAAFAFPLRLDTSMAGIPFRQTLLHAVLGARRHPAQFLMPRCGSSCCQSPSRGLAAHVPSRTALACALGWRDRGPDLVCGGRMAVPGLPIRLPHAVRPEPAGVAGRRAYGGQRVLQPSVAAAYSADRLRGDSGRAALQRQSWRLLHSRRRADRRRGRPRDGRAARACRDRLALAAQHLLRGAGACLRPSPWCWRWGRSSPSPRIITRGRSAQSACS